MLLFWCDYEDDADIDQKVIDIQWALAERGPKVEELLSKPLARETFTPEAMTSMFSALDRPPDHIKAQILSDILRLERAQLGVRAGGGVAEGSEVEATKVTRELLEFWGPVQAKVYWDVMVGFPGEFRSVSEDQVARFASLLA